MLLEALRSEFDREAATTARFLERLPADKLDWRPHPKAMTLGQLAAHLAMIPGWGAATLAADSFDVPEGYSPPQPEGAEAVRAVFKQNADDYRARLAALQESALAENWTLSKGGKTMFTMPRGAVVRMMIYNHLIHHRAQLGVYYRLLDVPVPSAYGPSGDEQPVF